MATERRQRLVAARGVFMAAYFGERYRVLLTSSQLSFIPVSGFAVKAPAPSLGVLTQQCWLLRYNNIFSL